MAFDVALDRPDLVAQLVFAGGAAFDASGVYPEMLALLDTFDPHAWTALVLKVNQLDRSGEPSWPREKMAALQSPTLLIIGDADIVRPEHTMEMFRLLGGGIPGDSGELPRAQLAVLPGTSHVGMLERTNWLSSMILAFLKTAPGE